MRTANRSFTSLSCFAVLMFLGAACLAPPQAPAAAASSAPVDAGSFDTASATYQVGGVATGVPPEAFHGGLSLSNNDETIVIVASGNYLFPTGLELGANYHVEVAAQPPTLFCSVVNHSGTMPAGPVGTANVSCVCAAGLGDCDHDLSNGCERSVTADDANCGGCGIVCTGLTTCQAGTCAARASLYRPVGLQSGVAEATVTGGGWSECLRGGFGESTAQAELIEHCTKKQIMYACRPRTTPASGTFSWLAWTGREVAFAADVWNVSSNGATWTSSFGNYMEAGDGTNYIWWAYSDLATPPLTLRDGGCGTVDYQDDSFEFVLFHAD